MSGVLLFAGAVAALVVAGVIPLVPNTPEQETAETLERVSGEYAMVASVTPEKNVTLTPGVVGSEVYDLSMYEESSEEYAQALGELEEPWLPQKAIVKPKGLEGGEYPDAPEPVYTSCPGQERTISEVISESVGTRTWIGDLAVGGEVTLEGVAQQGEWCFVSGETMGGTASGWVWCYRLHILE